MQGYLETADHLSARQFFIAVKKLADSLGYGSDRSPFLGSGIEFVQSRPYQWGDPIRSIDWRVTARTGKIHVKEYEAPKRLPCYLMIDTSASMAVSSVKRSKYAVAVHIAGDIEDLFDGNANWGSAHSSAEGMRCDFDPIFAFACGGNGAIKQKFLNRSPLTEQILSTSLDAVSQSDCLPGSFPLICFERSASRLRSVAPSHSKKTQQAALQL